MTVTILIEELQKYLTANLKEYKYFNSKNNMLNVEVVAGWPPPRQTAQQDILPLICIIPQGSVTEVYSRDNGGIVSLRLVFGIREPYTQEGWKALVSLVEHVRNALLVHRTIGRQFNLVGKVETAYEAEQPHPEWYADMFISYSIPKPLDERMLK